ncbi:MAG TPA: Rieske 2Fe-2S domain-containing protein [Chitinophagaceae bacterium]|nr:Rieske 2Fe-2S domain-containing protein [Chitinophagaceae bacterium]
MNEPQKLTWHKIASQIGEISFAKNNIASVEIHGKKICISKFQAEIFAFAHQCPHAAGFLAEGYLDKHGNVVCPVHQYKFDIRTGRNITGEGYSLKHWPVEVRSDGIYVGLNAETFAN